MEAVRTDSYDTRLKGGRVFLHEAGLIRADLLIQGTEIAGIVHPENQTVAADEVDVTGCIVLPGAIDPHVHLGKDIRVPRDPDDADLESASAVAGGVTSMLVYLMSSDPYEGVFQAARDVMSTHSRTDFGFHFVLGTQEHLASFPHYVSELGVSSFKFFMNFRGDEGAYLGMPGNDDSFMYDILGLSADHDAMINPHPENVELVWRLRNQARDESRGPLWAWHNSRPAYVEAEAQQRVAYLASVTGASMYAVHTSSEAALSVALRQRQSYPNIFIETCPHYLTLHTESEGLGTYGKVNPPLRPVSDVEALWQGIANDQVDCIGSDHNSRHRSQKERDIWTASAGFPGLGTLVPITMGAGRERGVDLATLVNLTSTRAAKLFGLYPRKGIIRIGSDADIAVVDPSKKTTLEASGLHSAAQYTPWEGQDVNFSIVHTLVRGRFAFRDGQLTDEVAGEYLERTSSGASALREIERHDDYRQAPLGGREMR